MEYRTCYYYDPADQKFSGTGLVPLINGEHPLPSFATWTKPVFEENEDAFWVNDFWEISPIFDATDAPISEQGDD